MTVCHSCGGLMTVTPSTFPGFDLLGCPDCGRAIKLIVKTGPRPSGSKRVTKTDVNRMMRSARRMNQRRTV